MKDIINLEKGQELFVGIDLHNKNWHVTIRTKDIVIFSANIPPQWRALKIQLDKYPDQKLNVVYEAGYFGFWLHDLLVDYGAKSIVTPPSLIPSEYGNKVKTDRKDSQKLAQLLSKGMLKAVYVPTEEELYHRQVSRRRRQFVRDRTRIQCRIKAELNFFGIEIPEAPSGKWTKDYVKRLKELKLNDQFAQKSFQYLVKEYEFLNEMVKKQLKLLKKLSQKEKYRERVKIIESVPGISLIGAMEILLELQNFERFNNTKDLAAYIGLTPSQYSSSDKIRMGRITKVGKNLVRAGLVESSWVLIRFDPAMRKKYEAIKLRSGAKRAIVAIARKLIIRIRRMVLDNKLYVTGLVY